MMRKMVVLGVALVLSFVFCSVSEAVNLQKAIIGKWVEVKKDGSWGGEVEFLKDGTVILITQGAFTARASTVGSYKFIDDNRLKMEISGHAMVAEVAIDKQGQLILSDPAGGITRHIVNTKAEREKWEKRVRAEKERERIEWEKRIKEKYTFSDLTVLDNETKLMWTRDANIAGKDMNWDDAFKFIASLNEQKYAGYSDWRLPSKEELETLVNFAKGQGITEKFDKYFNKIGFKNVQSFVYWSSTTVAGSTGSAWYVDMDGGGVYSYYTKTSDYYVLPVRAGQ